MADTTTTGRHRAAVRYSPVNELTTVLSRAGETGLKAGAVLAASGGLVAAAAVPAAAAPASGAVPASATAPAELPAAASAAPTIVAPAVQAPFAAPSLGFATVRAVAKPTVKADPVSVRVTTRASRSGTRTAVTSSPATPPPSIPVSSSNIVNIARSLLGIPYVYGGSTPAGFDCSGFTSYVYRQAGISIPRTAEAQRQAARKTSSPQPGDLVFYGIPAYHVGIYVSPGLMIDSPHSGTVTQVRSIYSSTVTYGTFR